MKLVIACLVVVLNSAHTYKLTWDSERHLLDETIRRPYSLTDDPDYMKQREKMIADEDAMRLGGRLVLQPEEQAVNKILMAEKTKMMDDSRINRTPYIPSLSFYQVKPKVENTTLLKLIRQMPKGGALHVHDLSGASIDWLIQNATYRDNIYMCVDPDSYILFKAFKTPPPNPDCPWKSVKEERAAASSPQAFDALLKKNLTMLEVDPVEAYPNNDKAWIRFQKFFMQVYYLIYYVPVFRDYYRRTLEEFSADNVQYLELRAQLWGLYDLEGKVYDSEFGLNLLLNVTEEFKKVNPNFIGAKVIMCGIRNSNVSVIAENVKNAVALKQLYPDFLAGYDLVSDEVWYNPLIYYLDALLYPSRMDPPYDLPYFFHAGETDWQGTEVDKNLVDAILLNTTRIGHGFALSKHPNLAKVVRTRQIGVEVNPISNQLLRLVTDLRNHPMNGLLAQDYPIVISSDDPSVWESYPLSHDFYMAFMAMSSEDADLTFLKQLAINSIRYSAMSKSERKAATAKWEQSWSTFIKTYLSQRP
ncbi:unnamed protein product [Lymnaea stagnalis]|uniref:adenosine deaminase n=1 Tax=Lymnaea stagnalis TaxID=6523 RepID=A0AAV2IJK8_LYMST